MKTLGTSPRERKQETLSASTAGSCDHRQQHEEYLDRNTTWINGYLQTATAITQTAVLPVAILAQLSTSVMKESLSDLWSSWVEQYAASLTRTSEERAQKTFQCLSALPLRFFLRTCTEELKDLGCAAPSPANCLDMLERCGPSR